METVTDFSFLGSKITVGGDCSHDIKRRLLLWRKAMTNLESILTSRDITLLTKVYPVTAVIFPVVLYRCESWPIKNAVCRITDASELWCWRRLDSPLDSKEVKRVNPKRDPSWIFTGRSDAKALATWCKDLTHWKRSWCWKRLQAGGKGDDRGWDDWTTSPTRRTWVWASYRSWWLTGKPGMLQSVGLQSQKQLSDWTDSITHGSEK